MEKLAADYLMPVQTRTGSPNPQIELSSNPAYSSTAAQNLDQEALDISYYTSVNRGVTEQLEHQSASTAAGDHRASYSVSQPASFPERAGEGARKGVSCLAGSVVAMVVMLVALLGLVIAMASLILTLTAQTDTTLSELLSML